MKGNSGDVNIKGVYIDSFIKWVELILSIALKNE